MFGSVKEGDLQLQGSVKEAGIDHLGGLLQLKREYEFQRVGYEFHRVETPTKSIRYVSTT